MIAIDYDRNYAGIEILSLIAAHLVLKTFHHLAEKTKTGKGEKIRQIGDDIGIGKIEGVLGYVINIGRTVDKHVVILLHGIFKPLEHGSIVWGVMQAGKALLGLHKTY